MYIAFTLCSINYLAQAKTLGDSLKQTNPDCKFVIGLVDKNETGADLSLVNDYTVLEVDKVGISGFEGMVEQYTIVELITAVKPFYFTYLFNNYPEVKKVIYFDPDIIVFDSLNELIVNLDSYDIVLTPHFTRPIIDDLLPTEKHVFNTGVFNLGFAAMARSENTFDALRWWERKLKTECILDLSAGYFVDQLWMNLAPAYFDKVLIEKKPGYNMAHWNLHERTITKKDGKYYSNNLPLVFYHFSHYSPSKPDNIAAYHNRYNFNTRPDIKPLFDHYRERLIANKFFELRPTPCYYMKAEKKKNFKKNFNAFLRKNVPLSVKMKVKKLLGK